MYSRISAVASGMAFLHAADRRHDLARRAVAALEGVVVDEGLLHRVQRAVAAGQALDRRDLPALGHGGQRQAGQHAAAVDQHRAGAALALVAALLGAGQRQVLAQRIQQGDARVERQRGASRPLIVRVMSMRASPRGGRGARRGWPARRPAAGRRRRPSRRPGGPAAGTPAGRYRAIASRLAAGENSARGRGSVWADLSSPWTLDVQMTIT